MPPRKRKQRDEDAEDETPLCVACSSSPANMVQVECGHCCLCTNCGFRCIVEVRFVFDATSIATFFFLISNISPYVCSCRFVCDITSREILQDRRCPTCRTSMLFPLSVQGAQQDITPALAMAGLEYAKSKGRGPGGDHTGVLQALKGCFSVIPIDEELILAWLDALETTVSDMVRAGATTGMTRAPGEVKHINLV